MSVEEKVDNIKDSQWEGFQMFNDHIQTIKLQESRHKEAQIKLTDNNILYQQPLTISIQDQLTSHRQISRIEDQTNRNQMDQNQKIVVENQIKEKIVPLLRKYIRIPIVKHQQSFRFIGKSIYRGIMPKASDTYFRVLRDVDFSDQYIGKLQKMNEQFVFDSKFESGNLNNAFQGQIKII